ncbi:MAG TPA: nucleotidyltransferase family protein [Candidatus Limnocylindrales bacterium]
MNRAQAPADNEIPILIWAAGGAAPLAPQPDPQTLLAAVRAHRLEVRLQRRLAQERPGWADESLLAGVTDLAQEARLRAVRQFDALSELLSATAVACQPTLVKGMTYFLLTGAEHTITRSVDLDLFAQDLPGLRDGLTALGFQADRKDPPQPYGRKVRHEFAKLSRGDVEIDLHRCFPVWSYTAEVADPRATRPADNPGIWSCVDSLRWGQVGAASIRASAVTRPGPNGRGVPLAGPEMAAIISCSHLFANYVAEFPRRFARIRLGELANLGELLATPGFDWPRFERMAALFHAADAVAFAFALVARWLGRTHPLPPGARAPWQPLPPRTLWFARGDGGFVVSTIGAEEPEDVVIRRTPHRRLVDHLEATRIRAGSEQDLLWYTMLPASGPRLTRVYLHRTDAPLLIRVAVSRVAGGLRFTVAVPPTPAGAETNLLLDFGDRIIECVEHPSGQLFAYDRTVERRFPPDTVKVRRRDGPDAPGYEVTVPWDLLPAGTPSKEEIAVVLGVRRWQTDGERPQAGTLVPLLTILR